MDNTVTQYTLQIFPYLAKDSMLPSSEVHVEISGDMAHFREKFAQWLDAFDLFRKHHFSDQDFQFRIWDGAQWGNESDKMVEYRDLYCNEEDIVFALLYTCKDFKDAVAVREIAWKGTVYTDISGLEVLKPGRIEVDEGRESYRFDAYPIRLCGKKEEALVKLCFFGPYTETDEICPYDDDEEEEDTPVIQQGTLSSGIVEQDQNRVYIGVYPCLEYWEGYEEIFWCLDENGDQKYRYTIRYTTEDYHMFMDVNGTDVTFSLLLNGRLYPKIRKTEEEVIFYYTPFDKKALISREFTRIIPGQHPKDTVFLMEEGKYRYSAANRGIKSAYDDVAFTPPQAPDLCDMDQDAARRLYEGYLDALYAAFNGAGKYLAGEVWFHRWTDEGNSFHASVGDYGLHADMLAAKATTYLLEEYDFEGKTSLLLTSADSTSETIVGEEIRLAMCPKEEDLELVIDTVPDTRSTDWDRMCCVSFNALNEGGFFAGAGLPKTISFGTSAESFIENIDIYNAIRNAVIEEPQTGKRLAVADVKKALLRALGRTVPKAAKPRNILNRAEMEQALYGDGMTPDPGVVSFALEVQNEYIRTGKIPGIAVIGEAGIGKSTLIDRLAGAVFGKGVMTNTPSDLKAPYIGQTKYETLIRLIQASANDRIFFIDEAYTLMTDQFGHEAVSLLLPLMTGDKNLKQMTARIRDTTISYNFETGDVTGDVFDDHGNYIGKVAPGYPTVWIAGYEDDIRLMLRENQGLYRRFRKLVLTAPTTDQLYGTLMRKLESGLDMASRGDWVGLERLKLTKVDQNPNMNEDARYSLEFRLNTLKKQFEDYEETIKRFFRWGTQPQNSKYFANYAGVENFISRCLDGIDFSYPEGFSDGPDYFRKQIDGIITSVKRDVRRQLETVRRKGNAKEKGSNQGNIEAGEQVEMVVDNKTRFKDLIGCEGQVAYMQTIINILKKKSEYDRFGITVPKGALLLGQPGVGKTFIAKAMAGEIQAQFDTNKRVGFMSLSAPEIISKPVSFIGSIFDKAEEYDVCVVFIDEVDAIAKKRSQNGHYAHFIELIKQMDGVEQRSNVFVLAATNAPESLDPAFVRSGRIDKKLAFRLPDRKALEKLARRYILERCEILHNFKLKGKAQLENPEQEQAVEGLAKEFAKNLNGWGCTAGDVENIVNTAFVMYDQGGGAEGGWKDHLACLECNLQEALERHFIGDPGDPDREKEFSVKQNNKSRSSTAVHEVGHALVNVLSGCEPFEKITSLPRGDALGYVMNAQRELYTKADYKNHIRSVMGGRIAEEIVYGKDNVSPGAYQDIRSATNAARLMVEQFGFADDLAFMSIREDTARYLGESEYSCSDACRAQSDQLVNALLKQLYQETMKMLEDKKELIIVLAEQVFNRKTMTGKEFTKCYQEAIKEVKD